MTMDDDEPEEREAVVEAGDAEPAFDSRVAWTVVILAFGWRLYTRNADASLDGFDEKIYRLFAETMGEQGLAGTRALIERYPTDKLLSIGPPPLRVFHTLLAVVACKLLGGYTTQNLAWLSWGAGVATLAVFHHTLRTWFGARTAWLSTLLVASSPLATALGRRALTDTLAALLVLSAIALFERAREAPRRGRLIALGAVLVAALLTKEGLFFTWPAFAVLAYVHTRSGTAVPRVLAAPFVVAPVVALMLLAFVCGGTDRLRATYSAYLEISDKIPYANHFQRGPWFRYVVDLVLASPLPPLLAIAGAVAPSEQDQRGARLTAAFALAGLLVFSALSMLNVRFVLFVDPLIRALAAVALVRLASWVARQRGMSDAMILVACALAVLASDVVQFDRIFVQGSVYDPVTANLVEANGMFAR